MSVRTRSALASVKRTEAPRPVSRRLIKLEAWQVAARGPLAPSTAAVMATRGGASIRLRARATHPPRRLSRKGAREDVSDRADHSSWLSNSPPPPTSRGVPGQEELGGAEAAFRRRVNPL